MKRNLISYSKITENNKIVSEGKMSKIIDKFNNVTAVAVKIEGLYLMKSKLKINDKNFAYSVNIENKNTENEMVSDYEDVVELGKEMEQISEENDEDKLNKSHDSEIRSDLND